MQHCESIEIHPLRAGANVRPPMPWIGVQPGIEFTLAMGTQGLGSRANRPTSGLFVNRFHDLYRRRVSPTNPNVLILEESLRH
jgi:hypothetical protein